jgi:hypothetical protein
MAVILRHAAAAAAALLVVATVCADGASTFYSSDPNLGSARVVFQVTRKPSSPYLPDIARLSLRDSPEMCGPNLRKRGDFYWFLGGESGSRVLNSPCSLRVWVLAAARFVPRIGKASTMWLGTGVISELLFAIRGGLGVLVNAKNCELAAGARHTVPILVGRFFERNYFFF